MIWPFPALRTVPEGGFAHFRRALRPFPVPGRGRSRPVETARRPALREPAGFGPPGRLRRYAGSSFSLLRARMTRLCVTMADHT